MRGIFKSPLFLVIFLVSITGALFVLNFFNFRTSTKPASASTGNGSISTQTEWEQGTRSNIDSTTSPGTISIDDKISAKLTIDPSQITILQGPATNKGNTIDGDWNSSWVGDYSAYGHDFMQIDLGSTYTIGKILSKFTLANFGMWSNNLDVYISTDGVNWTWAQPETFYQDTVILERLNPGQARYIKLSSPNNPLCDGEPAYIGVCAPQLYELEVHETDSIAVHTSTSTQLDAGDHDTVNWTTFIPTATVPENTSLSFKFRTSADSTNWSSWSASNPYAASIDLSGLTQQRYLQVESTLTNTDGLSTPTLDNYTANYDYSDTATPTCSDNIKNGDETGVDCGGSCTACPVTPTCDDNTQNGDETGVDCGGSCTACPTCSDGIKNGDETNVDCGGSCGACEPDPTCNDNTQNGDETGVDCGGSCPACVPDPTCNDNTQNGDETGVDCGGSCGECPDPPTCTDGIQNQGEENIDCGGPCAACIAEPTCTDGIQNGSETGVDCGGSCGECKLCPNNELNECRAAVEAKYQQCLDNAGGNPAEIQACYLIPCADESTCFTKCGLPSIDVFDDAHVIVPNGEEQYELTDQMEIKWDYYQLKRKMVKSNYAVKFSISTDSGKSYKEIKTLLPKGQSTSWIPDGTPYDYYVVKDKNGAISNLHYWESTEGYLSYEWEIPNDFSLVSNQVRIKLDPIGLCTAGQSDESDRDFKIVANEAVTTLMLTVEPSYPTVEPGNEVTYTAKSYISQENVTDDTIFGFKLNSGGEIVEQDENRVTVKAGNDLGEFPNVLTVTASYRELTAIVPAGLKVFASSLPPDPCTGAFCDIKNIVEDIKGYSANSALSLIIASLLALGILLANAMANGLSLMKGSQLFSFFAKGLDKENAKGVVYDAFSGLPIPYAKVILINQEKTVDAIAVSGKDGKFALPVTPGEMYTIKIDKTGFLLFDSNAREQNGFLKYELKLNNNYFGEDYLADSEEYFFDKNIPLIPDSSSTALVQKTRLWENISRALLILNSAIITVGFSFSILAVVVDQSAFNIIVLALYVALLVFYLVKYIFYTGRGYGVVVDNESQPLGLVLIRAIRSKDKKLIKTIASDKKGRFGLALPKGYYTIHASKEGLAQKDAIDLLIKSNLSPTRLNISMETIILPAKTEIPEIKEENIQTDPIPNIITEAEHNPVNLENNQQPASLGIEQKHFDNDEEDRYATDASEIIGNYR